MNSACVEQTPENRRHPSRLPWILVLLLAVLLAAAGLRIYYLTQVERETAVALSPTEQQTLDEKLAVLREASARAAPGTADPAEHPAPDTATTLAPEVYEEDPEQRYLRFTERELNAAIARDPALAGRAAVRLSPEQVSSTFLVDVPEDLPLFGGRRLRVQAGMRLTTEGNRVEARLLGVSLAGVPLPDAWLGGFKGRDLLEGSALSGLGAGIESVEVGDGWVALRLAP
ncbi:MAG: hypothetical protein EA347_06825 [Thioalkalivibrio sp.]|nr:MAG: hypothetical protein EA347_06825 [Thioalkalivibrio sp.]